MQEIKATITGFDEDIYEAIAFLDGTEIRIDPLVSGLVKWEERETILGEGVFRGYWYVSTTNKFPTFLPEEMGVS